MMQDKQVDVLGHWWFRFKYMKNKKIIYFQLEKNRKYYRYYTFVFVLFFHLITKVPISVVIYKSILKLIDMLYKTYPDEFSFKNSLFYVSCK